MNCSVPGYSYYLACSLISAILFPSMLLCLDKTPTGGGVCGQGVGGCWLVLLGRKGAYHQALRPHRTPGSRPLAAGQKALQSLGRP